jgi:hypothetical protein
MKVTFNNAEEVCWDESRNVVKRRAMRKYERTSHEKV